MKPVVWLALSLLITAFAFQNCGSQMTTEFSNAPIAIDPEIQKVQAPDCTFNRTGLLNGEEVVAYRVSTVPLGTPAASGCEAAANKEIRKCENGILNGIYQFASCQPGAPRSCVVDGITVGHGKSIKLYQVNDYLDSTPGCEGAGNWRNVVCNDGRFDSNFPTYKYSLCQDRKQFDCKYDLAQPAILEGNGKYFYKSSNPTASEGCQREYRRCVNGKLQGTMNAQQQAVFTALECREQPGRKCPHPVPGQPEMEHRQSIAFFPVASVAHGQTCPESVSRQCLDGVLQGREDAVYMACTTREAASCPLENTTVPNGQSVSAYGIPVAATQALCDQSKSTRKCTNGNLDGNTEHRYAGCRVDPNAASCVTTDGEPILHGATDNLYRRNLVISSSASTAYCSASDNVRSVRCESGTFVNLDGSAIPTTEKNYKFCGAKIVPLPLVKTYTAPESNAISCPEGKRAIGVYGVHNATTAVVYSLGLICEGGVRTGKTGSSAVGAEFNHTCQDSSNPDENVKKFVVGFYMRVNSTGHVSRLDVHCARLDGSSRYDVPATAGRDTADMPVAYRICSGGQILGRVRSESTTSTVGLRPPHVECIKIAKSANIDCQSTFGEPYCEGGVTKKIFYETQPRGGNGQSCEYQNEQIVLFSDQTCGGSGGGPNPPPDGCYTRESEAGVETFCP